MPRHTQNKAEDLFIRAMIATEKELKRIKTKGLPKLEEELNDAALSIISKWYASYEPYVYRRQMSLKKAFKVTVNMDEQKIEFNSKFMDEAGFQHHQSNEIIFNNSFMNGYHGGSWGEGIYMPLWRQPVPYYYEWGRPAYQSFSPYEEIKSETDRILDRDEKYNISRLSVHINAAKKNLQKYMWG